MPDKHAQMALNIYFDGCSCSDFHQRKLRFAFSNTYIEIIFRSSWKCETWSAIDTGVYYCRCPIQGSSDHQLSVFQLPGNSCSSGFLKSATGWEWACVRATVYTGQATHLEFCPGFD